MMPSGKTLGIAASIVVGIVLIMNGLADSVSRAAYNVGLSQQVARDLNSIVFFGGLFLLVVLALKAIPRLSRV